MFHVPWGRLSL